jgi:2-polyprenyl-6-methoxyphenol hydroxylase-like FAD-dependent oxidoreductase
VFNFCEENDSNSLEEHIPMIPNKTSRIAIIGAGPGGLTLARILQSRNIPTTIFEREKNPDERPQGGTLDLHPESGQLAVHRAGLDEQFHTIARYEDQGMRRLSKEGQVLFEMTDNEESGDRPEVDRSALRAMLLGSLAPGTVQWGYNLRSVQQADSGAYELQFEHGVTETFDLVVGADGAWSRVRPLLSSATPTYTGVTFIEFGLDDVDAKHPVVAQLVGHGSMFAPANNKGLFAQRNGHHHIRVYAGIRKPEGWETANGFDAGNPQKARTWLLDQFSDFDTSLLALIQESSDRFVIRPLSMLPVGHRWNCRPGVTLLGDAAHLMSPFSGEGVNLAMLDASDLARAISECSTLEEAVRTYEETMFTRAEPIARGADEGLKNAVGPDGARHLPPVIFRQQMSSAPSFPSKTRRESFIDDLIVRVDEQGSGRPVLILHGAAGPQSVSGIAEGLARQAYTLVPTHPGFENEPRPEWFNSVEDLAFTYLDLLERLDLRDVLAIGLSFGGWIAAEMAVLNTTRLGGLILVDAAGIQIDEHPMTMERPATSDKMPTGARSLQVYIGPNGLRDSKLRRRLARVSIPVLCIWGENDIIVSPTYGRAYAQSFPNAHFELIPEAGHLSQIDQPERLLALVREFMDSIPMSACPELLEQQ